MATNNAINNTLTNSGVSAGSYTNSSITVNAQGLLTSASSGSSTPSTSNFSLGGINIPSPVFLQTRATVTGLTTGDFYTCPANKKAIVLSGSFFSSGGTSMIVELRRKISATYYMIYMFNSINSSVSAPMQNSYVLEAGESLNWNHTSGASTGYIDLTIIECTNTLPIKTYTVNTTSGDNVVKTIAGGTTGLLIGNKFSFNDSNTLNFCQSINSNRTIYWNIYNTSAGTSNQVTGSFQSDARGQSSSVCDQIVPAGYSISVNSNSASTQQSAYVTLWEF